MMQNEDTYEYQYFLKDHLGNTRITLSQNGTLLQEDAYYPFGMNIAGLSSANTSPENKYKYNSKELQDEFGVDWYDYGWRQYDPALGRFMTQDRFAEKYYDISQYQYAANNPILYIDVNGDSLMFFENGVYVTTLDDGKEEFTGFNQSIEEDEEGNKTYTGGSSFSFNDIDLDKKDLRSGDVELSFMSSGDVNEMVEESGAGDQNFLSAWAYAATESNAGNLDFYTKLSDNKFYIIDGIGYNTHDAGNYLWGNAMAKMGFGEIVSRSGAHLNAWWSGKESNGEAVTSLTHNALQRAFVNRTWSGDSKADQRAISAGHRGYFK